MSNCTVGLRFMHNWEPRVIYRVHSNLMTILRNLTHPWGGWHWVTSYEHDLIVSTGGDLGIKIQDDLHGQLCFTENKNSNVW